MSAKIRGGDAPSRSVFYRNRSLFLCLASFMFGTLFTNRSWTLPEAKYATQTTGIRADRIQLFSNDHIEELDVNIESKGIHGNASKSHFDIQGLNKTISNSEIKLDDVRTAHKSGSNAHPQLGNIMKRDSKIKRRYLAVIGINTAFSSQRRRDSIRSTWMPEGEKRKKLKEEKGIIIRFVIGHSSSTGSVLDKAIEAEDRKYGDFLRLEEHIEGYLQLSAKTKLYFSTAVALWDADFYVKVDDDIHVNIDALRMTLAAQQSKPRLYIGCMKSGPVLAKKGAKYHEPEYLKFGEEGNKYFRHATGQIYAISKDLATYISTNQDVLHKYANEDVSLGAWIIGLDVEHIDDRSFCCGTPPDCELKSDGGNICVASYDWKCSGVCNSVERMKLVHQRCGEVSE